MKWPADLIASEVLASEVMVQLALVMEAGAGGLYGVDSEASLRVVEAVEAVKAWADSVSVAATAAMVTEFETDLVHLAPESSSRWGWTRFVRTCRSAATREIQVATCLPDRDRPADRAGYRGHRRDLPGPGSHGPTGQHPRRDLPGTRMRDPHRKHRPGPQHLKATTSGERHGATGGTTTETNLAALHRGHHNLKTSGFWDSDQFADGTVCWTTATDRTVTTYPYMYEHPDNLPIDASNLEVRLGRRLARVLNPDIPLPGHFSIFDEIGWTTTLAPATPTPPPHQWPHLLRGEQPSASNAPANVTPPPF